MRPGLCSVSLGALHAPAQGFRTVRTKHRFHGHPGHDTVSPTPHLTMHGALCQREGTCGSCGPSRGTDQASPLGGDGGPLGLHVHLHLIRARRRQGGSHAPGGRAGKPRPHPRPARMRGSPLADGHDVQDIGEEDVRLRRVQDLLQALVFHEVRHEQVQALVVGGLGGDQLEHGLRRGPRAEQRRGDSG